MNVALSPALRQFVDSQIANGRYLDAGDVIRASLRRMEAQELALGRRCDADSTSTISASGGTIYPNLGALADGDTMATVFIVMMEAAKSAREDLKAIMDGVKAINKQKDGWRSVADTVNRLAAAVAGKCDDFKVSSLGFVTKKDIDNVREAVRNKLDGLSELGEMESLRLQMAMDRLSKMMSTLSNMVKKISDTANSITHDIR